MERQSQSHGWHGRSGAQTRSPQVDQALKGQRKTQASAYKLSAQARSRTAETCEFTIKEGAEQSKRGERAQRAVCAGQRQLPCNPGDHSTGQRRQGRAVHTGKHYRMRQRHTSAPGACVVQRARRRAEGKRRWRFDRSRVGGALLLFAPFWLCRRGTDVMTRGDCSNSVPKATAKAPVKRWKKERRGEERRGRASCSFP